MRVREIEKSMNSYGEMGLDAWVISPLGRVVEPSLGSLTRFRSFATLRMTHNAQEDTLGLEAQDVKYGLAPASKNPHK